ncbi:MULTISPECIES: hypothetical protein [Pseudomonas]|uniref:Uncharacterized protein n=1 Tax=Pseudomonas fluorescens TaxID=294 RepID=A0A944DEJ7_PSEFL|nr:hypothetical protein [Pseudomonas fluorescens]MBT2298195.1 hypothetical protein [Pseudomonas fluorescens]MBT2309682.1 hypothetical protein [Pseudomonas fluorescens]MBT2314845.1 hypothetical protein [Pseudomonas fluorescens]MBT2327751.1 hypothetical protein [Pseudomonas fluorescens]MBT2345498.1 hypothetical protein [Pseudomonas fluorescens]
MESFWLCDDCLFAAAYEDYSALSLYYTADQIAQRIAALQAGLARLMPISADFDPESGWGVKTFSSLPCDGCGSPLHGQRHQFTRL